MNYQFSIGDVVKSYDFRGNEECYVVGKVVSLDRNYITLDVCIEVWQGRILDVEKRIVNTAIEIFEDWNNRLVKLA